KAGERRRLLASMLDAQHSHVVFESPHRLVAALKDVVETLGPDRPIAVCRELTKKFEEIVRGSASGAVERFERQAPRGEITIVIGPAGGRRAPDGERDA